jgi:hypothetical protein
MLLLAGTRTRPDRRSIMKKLLKTAAIGAIAIASSFALAQPAMASSLSWNVSDGVRGAQRVRAA